VYLGTYRHLQALYQLARQNRWDILGPNQETGSAVLVRGIRNGRQIFIASNRLGLSVSVSSLEELWVLVLEWLPALDPSWAERLWPFSRAEARRRPQRALADVARKGHYLDARGKRRTFYLFPPQGETVDGESLAALGQALAAGRTFLRPRTEVWSPGGTLELFQPKVFAIRAGAQEIAALLDWMIQVCQVMEACRMAEFVDNDRGSAELDL
jgi:hypothetical protein